MVFPLTRHESKDFFPSVLSPWRTFIQTKWRKYKTTCLATTTLLDTYGSDGSGNSPQWRTPIRHATGSERLDTWRACYGASLSKQWTWFWQSCWSPHHSTSTISSQRKSETCEGKRQRRAKTWRQFKHSLVSRKRQGQTHWQRKIFSMCLLRELHFRWRLPLWIRHVWTTRRCLLSTERSSWPWKWRRSRSSGRCWRIGKWHVFFVCCSGWCHCYGGSSIRCNCSSCRHVVQWSWPWSECSAGTSQCTSLLFFLKGERKRGRQRQVRGQIPNSSITFVTGRSTTTNERTANAKLNALLVDERDIGRMIANVECLPPVRLRKNQTRRARMTTQQHLSYQAKHFGMFCSQWLQRRPWYIRVHGRSKRTSSNGVSQTDTFDTDSICHFRRCWHQDGRYFRRSRHGWQRWTMVEWDRSQDRLEHVKSIPTSYYRNLATKTVSIQQEEHKSTEDKHETNHINNKHNDTNMNTRKMHNTWACTESA